MYVIHFSVVKHNYGNKDFNTFDFLPSYCLAHDIIYLLRFSDTSIFLFFLYCLSLSPFTLSLSLFLSPPFLPPSLCLAAPPTGVN